MANIHPMGHPRQANAVFRVTRPIAVSPCTYRLVLTCTVGTLALAILCMAIQAVTFPAIFLVLEPDILEGQCLTRCGSSKANHCRLMVTQPSTTMVIECHLPLTEQYSCTTVRGSVRCSSRVLYKDSSFSYLVLQLDLFEGRCLTILGVT